MEGFLVIDKPAGITSHAMAYIGRPGPENASTMNAIRSRIGSRPIACPTPAATPPTTRSSVDRGGMLACHTADRVAERADMAPIVAG